MHNLFEIDTDVNVHEATQTQLNGLITKTVAAVPPSIRRDRIEDNSRNEEPCRFKRSQSSEMFECAAAVLLSQYRAP